MAEPRQPANIPDESHMWGRIMNIDVTTYTGEDGKPLDVCQSFRSGAQPARNSNSWWGTGKKSRSAPQREMSLFR